MGGGGLGKGIFVTWFLGRRTVFFGAATIICVALVPAAPPQFRWAAWATAALGLFWFLLMSVEDLLNAVRRD